ncbi:hypothetical protein SLA_6967 [Streptomyces laurentii]|uniref:Uncharacterized protein n=1 Tax=Streptomyces laurentii TaxID=39478 RepID=A0A160P9W0_STRLU|nr:hypothetical protein SLA_6967 [Streptomyces laurentii]
MELVKQALPQVEAHAERVAEAACNLADDISPDGWSASVAEDVLDTIDVLAEALCEADPGLARFLGAVTAATTTARRRLGLPVDGDPEPASSGRILAFPRDGRRPKQRALRDDYRAIRSAL